MSAAVPVVHAVVEPELKEGLAEMARENERTEAAELRLALRRHLEAHRAAHRAIALAAAGDHLSGGDTAAATA